MYDKTQCFTSRERLNLSYGKNIVSKWVAFER